MIFFRNSEASLRTGLAPVFDRITTRGRNAIFGFVARLPDNIPPHYAKSSYRSVDPQTLHGNVHQVDHVPNGPTNFAAITTMFPLRLCGGKLLVAVTRERRCGPSRLRVNDDDHDVTATGTHMPYWITQCYLPPGRGDIPALTRTEAGTRFSDPRGMQG